MTTTTAGGSDNDNSGEEPAHLPGVHFSAGVPGKGPRLFLCTNSRVKVILGHALCFSLGEFGRQYAIYGVLTEPGALPFARAMI